MSHCVNCGIEEKYGVCECQETKLPTQEQMRKSHILNRRIAPILEDLISMDDYIIDINKKLEVVLINLKIESAHIKETNGIMPIANELERLINGIDTRVSSYIAANRTDIRKLIKTYK
jgi:hypothetical protein